MDAVQALSKEDEEELRLVLSALSDEGLDIWIKDAQKRYEDYFVLYKKCIELYNIGCQEYLKRVSKYG